MTKDVKWAIDQAHSEITFKVKHLMIAHSNGTFKKFDANIYTANKDFETAEIDLWIDPTSIITGDAKRDTHLKGSDFFDVENHKQITFKSSTIGKNAKGGHELWGELTIKGITKPVKLEVQFGGIAKDPYGHEKAGFTVTGVIKRSDWGLIWNAPTEAGGLMVSDEVAISCDVELVNVNQKELAMELEPSASKKIGF
ncbi:MAG TPA: YceI family protein [Bacteroidia bacterium]|jgi:polyisoprenoid-binding protein YceI|nr:YceI family protein [Bacteroidia bacterium]